MSNEDWVVIDEAIERNLERSLRELEKLCSQPSIAAQGIGMEDCATLVNEMLASRGFMTRTLATKGYPVVYGEQQGRADKTLIFYNHYDVQPAEPLELWHSPPFQPSRRNGKIYARGVSDDKGHILCRLAAVDALLEVHGELPCRVKFLIEGEEEIGSVHLHDVVEENQTLLEADACVWEFGRVNEHGTPILDAGLRGILYVELEVRTASRDAHSGTGGSIFPNAAWRLIWCLRSLKDPSEKVRLPGFYDRVQPPSHRDMDLLEKIPSPASFYLEEYDLSGFIGDPKDDLDFNRQAVFEPTCTICGLTAGYQGEGSKTVLPAQASAKVDFRLVPDQDPEEVLGQLSEHLKAEGFDDVSITVLGMEPPAKVDPDHPFLQMVAALAEPVYGEPALITPMLGGSGPNHAFIKELGVPIATAGLGYPGSNVHAPDENIRIDLFEKGVKHTARVMEAFGKGGE